MKHFGIIFSSTLFLILLISYLYTLLGFNKHNENFEYIVWLVSLSFAGISFLSALTLHIFGKKELAQSFLLVMTILPVIGFSFCTYGFVYGK